MSTDKVLNGRKEKMSSSWGDFNARQNIAYAENNNQSKESHFTALQERYNSLMLEILNSKEHVLLEKDRRAGATQLLATFCVANCLANDNYSVGVKFTTFESLCYFRKKCFGAFERLKGNNPLYKEYVNTTNQKRLFFKNGSTIYLGKERQPCLKGCHLNLIVFDEANYQEYFVRELASYKKELLSESKVIIVTDDPEVIYNKLKEENGLQDFRDSLVRLQLPKL